MSSGASARRRGGLALDDAEARAQLPRATRLDTRDAVEQHLDREARDLTSPRVDGAETRKRVAALIDIVEPDDRDVARHVDPLLAQHAQGAETELVVEREDGVELHAARQQH